MSNNVVYWLDSATGDRATSAEFVSGAASGDLFPSPDGVMAWVASQQLALAAAGTTASAVGGGSNLTVLLIADVTSAPNLRVRHRIPPERVRGRIPPERVRQVIP